MDAERATSKREAGVDKAKKEEGGTKEASGAPHLRHLECGVDRSNASNKGALAIRPLQLVSSADSDHQGRGRPSPGVVSHAAHAQDAGDLPSAKGARSVPAHV